MPTPWRRTYQIHDDRLVNTLKRSEPATPFENTKQTYSSVGIASARSGSDWSSGLGFFRRRCNLPYQKKLTCRCLVQTGSLRVQRRLVPHRLFEAKKPSPTINPLKSRSRSPEERVLQNALGSSKRSEDVDTVIVKLPSWRREAHQTGLLLESLTRSALTRRVCTTYGFQNWYCFRSVRTRPPRSQASLRCKSRSAANGWGTTRFTYARQTLLDISAQSMSEVDIVLG